MGNCGTKTLDVQSVNTKSEPTLRGDSYINKLHLNTRLSPGIKAGSDITAYKLLLCKNAIEAYTQLVCATVIIPQGTVIKQNEYFYDYFVDHLRIKNIKIPDHWDSNKLEVSCKLNDYPGNAYNSNNEYFSQGKGMRISPEKTEILELIKYSNDKRIRDQINKERAERSAQCGEEFTECMKGAITTGHFNMCNGFYHDCMKNK